MSQQFAFWKTGDQLDSRAVYEELGVAESVPGLEVLDLDLIDTELVRAFPGWNVEARRHPGVEQTMLGGLDGTAGLDIGYGPQYVIVTCYGGGAPVWNTVIETMGRLGFPLYDPQINERFD